MYKKNLISLYPLKNKIKNIGYDFDGVFHRSINKYTLNGQGHPNFKENIKDYIPNLNIIDKIKREINEGNNVYIISRNPNDKSEFLKKYKLNYFLKNNHIYVASNHKPKYKFIEELNITEFTEDSINELYNIITNISKPIKLFLILTFKYYSEKEAEIVNYSKENRKIINELFIKFFKYSGSGIFLISKYKDEYIVFLIKDYDGSYSDPGGKIEPNNDIRENAIRELQEETYNTFILNKKNLNENNSYTIHSNYKTYFYFIEFNKDLIEQYYINKQILEKKNIANHWKETTEFNYFKLNDIINSFKSTAFINGYDKDDNIINNCKISDRVLKTLQYFMHNKNLKNIRELNELLKKEKFNKLNKKNYKASGNKLFLNNLNYYSL